MTESLKERAVAWGYSAGWGLVRLAPERFAQWVFRQGADLAFRRERARASPARRRQRHSNPGGRGGTQLRRNLARVLGVDVDRVPDELVQDSLRSYARYWCDVFRLPAMDHARLAEAVDAGVDGREHLAEALARGRGVVIALPHMGNWDLAGVWLVAFNGTFSTVAERLKPESLYRKFLAYREGLGFEILPHRAGDDEAAGEGPYQVLAERLRAGQVVCLLADRGMGKTGVPVRFFGEYARMPAGPAKLAALTGAALVTAHSWYEQGGGWRLRIDPSVDVSGGVVSATQQMATAFEAQVAEHPAHWHMLQPFWDADRAR